MVNNTLKYKDYIAQIHFDLKDEIFIGKVINTADYISFHANSMSKLKQEFEAMIDFYLKDCNEKELKPNRMYSGRFILRIAPDLHHKLAMKAAEIDISLNSLAAQLVESGLHSA